MPYVLVKDLPETIQATLKKRGYHKVDIQVLVQEKSTLHSSSGKGYRSFTDLVHMSTGETHQFTGSWGGANAFNPSNQVDLNDNEYTIPRDVAVIKGYEGGARGTVGANVVLSPSNVLPLLSPAPQLSEKQLHILGCMRSLISAYRKPILDSNKDVVDSLVEQGYIKRSKNGALQLTTKGKTASEKVKVL